MSLLVRSDHDGSVANTHTSFGTNPDRYQLVYIWQYMQSGTVYKHEIALSRRDGKVDVLNWGGSYYDIHYQLYNPYTHQAFLSFFFNDLNKPDWRFDQSPLPSPNQSHLSPQNQTTYREFMHDLFRNINKERPLLSASWVRNYQMEADAMEFEIGKPELKAAFYQRADRTLRTLHTMRRGRRGHQDVVEMPGQLIDSMPRAIMLRTFRFQRPDLVLAS